MPLNDLFQLCRERVTAEEAARYYGYVPDRRGKVLCPFHPDRHPSLSFHRGNFRCWSCGAAGSAIDFSARLFGLAPLDAVRKLNEDLGLDLPVDRAAGPEERERARREAELRETRKIFEEWRQTMLTRLCAAIRTGNVALRRPMEDWDTMFRAVAGGKMSTSLPSGLFSRPAATSLASASPWERVLFIFQLAAIMVFIRHLPAS